MRRVFVGERHYPWYSPVVLAHRAWLRLFGVGGDASPTHYPRRGDDVEAWIKRARDDVRYGGEEEAWMAAGLDRLLDRYRECADYGLTLRPEDALAGDPW